ncbi:MAG: dihydroorotate dehydrogenase electron transfer subunit [Thermodesulfobacteriota bacterium]
MKRKIKEVKAKIVHHSRLGEKYFNLRLLSPEIARLAQPGQFVMLRVAEAKDPFLRRPFSLARIFPPREKEKNKMDQGVVEIWYQVRGRGTHLMSQLSVGEKVDILGPLGRGFWITENLKKAILVGGGIGLAPLIAWAEKMQGEKKKQRLSEEDLQVSVLVGGKSREEILGWRELKKMKLEPQIITEDGSWGRTGLVTDLLESELMTGQNEGTVIYACGPGGMLIRVAQIADQFDIPCQVLLESRMACGLGACLGCAVKVRVENAGQEFLKKLTLNEEGEDREMPLNRDADWKVSTPLPFRYARVCQEGPVFLASTIIWE